MRQISQWVYFVLITSIALLGCKGKKEAATYPPLDLKGFQVIRTDESTGGETIFTAKQYEESGSIHILDKIGAGHYPPNVTLVTTARCWEGEKDTTENEVRNAEWEAPFTGPVSIYKLLPEEVLFRPDNTTSDTLSCTIDVFAKDNFGSQRVLKNALSGTLKDALGRADVDILLGQQVQSYALPELPIVHKEDWDQYSLRISNPSPLGSYKLLCERFVLEDASLTSVGYLDFEWVPQNKITSLDPDSDEDQICRFITYDQNSTRSGVSPYFLYRKYRIDFPKNLSVVRHKGTENEMALNSDDLIKTQAYDISDVITADAYPKYLQIQARTHCPEIRADEGPLTHTVTVPLTGPVPFYSLLPERALFQKYNQSSDSLQCTIEIKIQHTRAKNRAITLTVHGTLHDTYQARSLKVLKNSFELIPPRSGEQFDVQMSELHQYVLRADKSQVFDSYQLVCETFSLTGEKFRDGYFDLKQLNLSNTQLQNSNLPLTAVDKQLCRFFIYKNDVLMGYSYYFNLRQEMPTPIVKLDLTAKSEFLGTPAGSFGVNYHSSAQIGQLQISNPSSHAMYVLVDLDEPLARLQWVGGVPDSTPERLISAKLYEVFLKTEVASGHTPQSVEYSASQLYKIPANETLRINYLIQRFSACHLNNSGGYKGMPTINIVNGPLLGGGTFGIQYEIFTPNIFLVTSDTPLKPEAVAYSGSIKWSLDKGAAKGSGVVFASELSKRIYGTFITGFETENATYDNCRVGGNILDLR